MRTGEQAGGASASDSENATSAGATSTDLSSSDLNAELGLEQSYFDVLYEHLDALRIQAAAALADLISRPTANTPAALSDRDAFIRQFAVRVAQLDSVEDRLCFGKLDLHGGERRYIGRIGISDEHRNQLLVDWRAPAAEAFLPGHRRRSAERDPASAADVVPTDRERYPGRGARLGRVRGRGGRRQPGRAR